jgi:mono/diheme cytochrome c family protein
MDVIALLLAALPATASAQDADGLDHFEKRVRPLLAEHCHSCHSAKAEKLKGGLLLDTTDGLRKGGDTGPLFAAGDPDRSLLLKALRHADPDLKMPPKKRLPDAAIADVETWIRAGAPMPATTSKAAVDPAKARDHWAFRPPKDVAPTGPGNPIDAFLRAKLREKGLSFNPPADHRALIRRVTFDLSGLPPTAEELEDDYEKAVDRLLASPRYGERWGRHWLDVARHADTKGYVYEDREESRFIHSWVYRDWVIRAFNEDLPYDRFLMLQLAPEQVSKDPRDLAAAGFLTVGRRFINNIHDIIDDRIDTVTRGMLALTASCARCHDHKFDPIPTREYYGLYGVFHASTEKAVPLAEPKDEAYLKEFAKRNDAWEKKLADRTRELLDRLRAKTPDYLVAALDVSKFPTEEFYEILGADDLKPFIVRRWAAYIDRFKKDVHPVWGAWHGLQAIPERDLAEKAPAWLEAHRGRLNPAVAAALDGPPPANMQEVARRYGKAFATADAELREILHGAGSPIATPQGAFSEIEWFYDENVRQELGKLHREVERWILQSPAAAPWAQYLDDRPPQPNPRVFRRGNPANKGEEVPRAFLSVLGGGAFQDGSGRLELARAIASADNPLTARVWVNRVWLQHFGEGLVRTPSDFGLRSEPPTHPELLDWLARRFVADGWSTKKLHRLILSSDAYRQSSVDNPAARAVDPENRLLARFPRRRLDFESTRDAFLAASGRLDLAGGGKSVNLAAATASRRTVYGFIDRLNVPNLYRAFDFASVDAHSPQRFTTTVPQQALFLMNSPFMVEQARGLLKRAPDGPPEPRIRELYRLLFGRAPSDRELSAGLRFTEGAIVEPVVVKPGPWRYGFGEYDPKTERTANFTELPHFTGSAWQGGASWPDPTLGWVQLTAQGGHVGNDLKHAAVRRWVAPVDGTISISGTLAHKKKEGDGIRGKMISSRSGEIASFTLHNQEAETKLKGIEVKAGDAIDFLVDCRPAGEITWDEFSWAPVIKLEKAAAAANAAAAAQKDQEWSAAGQFGGPPPRPLTQWEKYAQALLLTNEFVFVD